MELEIDFSEFEKQFSEEEIKEKIKKSIQVLAFECEGEAKRIVSEGAVDSGLFLNSIFTETWEEGDEIGFTMYDGISYGKFHEFGTVRHWVPFFKYVGKVDGVAQYDTSEPILADWGKRVLNLTEEEMLERGGMNVKLSELMPFRKALAYIEAQAGDIFKEEFEK